MHETYVLFLPHSYPAIQFAERPEQIDPFHFFTKPMLKNPRIIFFLTANYETPLFSMFLFQHTKIPEYSPLSAISISPFDNGPSYYPILIT
jgi:hypothetical protein